MKKREAKSSIDIKEYIRLKKIYGHFEVKDTRGKLTFNLKNFEPQQTQEFLATEESGLCIKWSDEDSRLKVCDIIHTPPRLGAYYVIKYPKSFFIIYADKVIEQKELGFKSLTENKARELCIYECRI